MWMNPLPAETVMGAIVGAVLSTILAQYSYFTISVWTESRGAVLFVALILIYGVSAHFFCAACRSNISGYIKYGTLMSCMFILGGIVIINPRLPVNVTELGVISFRPNEGNILLDGVLAIWLAALWGLTLMAKHMDQPESSDD